MNYLLINAEFARLQNVTRHQTKLGWSFAATYICWFTIRLEQKFHMHHTKTRTIVPSETKETVPMTGIFDTVMRGYYSCNAMDFVIHCTHLLLVYQEANL